MAQDLSRSLSQRLKMPFQISEQGLKISPLMIMGDDAA